MTTTSYPSIQPQHGHNRFPPDKGFAILIKALGAKRTFVPREGETITITDKSGKELWRIKVPIPNSNPGVIISDVQIHLSTERDFGKFYMDTWRPALPDPQPTPPSPAGEPHG